MTSTYVRGMLLLPVFLVLAACGSGVTDRAVDRFPPGAMPEGSTPDAPPSIPVVEPLDPDSPAPDLDVLLRAVAPSLVDNLNERDGSVGSVCWAAREINRLHLQVSLFEAAGLNDAELEGTAALSRKDAVKLLGSAASELALVEADSRIMAFVAEAREAAEALAARLAESSDLSGRPTAAEVYVPLEDLSGSSDFRFEAERSPACRSL